MYFNLQCIHSFFSRFLLLLLAASELAEVTFSFQAFLFITTLLPIFTTDECQCLI